MKLNSTTEKTREQEIKNLEQAWRKKCQDKASSEIQTPPAAAPDQAPVVTSSGEQPPAIQ